MQEKVLLQKTKNEESTELVATLKVKLNKMETDLEQMQEEITLKQESKSV
jgi:hypothetical protein